MILEKQIKSALENIYISPLEGCNLNCRLCYTKKTAKILENQNILNFINRYKKAINLKSIIFCGGEVFRITNLPELINELTQIKLFVTIITNGTIDRLAEIKDPQNCQLLVSLDGPKKIHDKNRGEGNFQKTIDFIKKAVALGFPVEIMFLITLESYPYRNSFPQFVNLLINNSVKVNYLTQKISFYTQNHPLANSQKVSGLTPSQIVDIKKNYPSIPPKNFGCFQLSLQSNGRLYGCCESPVPIGKITDSVKIIINNFKKSLQGCQKCGNKNCSGCCQPNFLCGYINELGMKKCDGVVKLLNNETMKP